MHTPDGPDHFYRQHFMDDLGNLEQNAVGTPLSYPSFTVRHLSVALVSLNP